MSSHSLSPPEIRKKCRGRCLWQLSGHSDVSGCSAYPGDETFSICIWRKWWIELVNIQSVWNEASRVANGTAMESSLRGFTRIVLWTKKIWETKKHFSQHRLQQLFFDKPLIVNSCSATAPAVRLVCRMRRSALRGKRKIRISSRAQKDTIMIQKNTQKDYGCHSNDSCVKILFAPINSPLEAMRHHVKHWSLLLLLSAVASGVFAFTKNFFHLVAFRCPFDLVPSGDFAYTVPVSLCAMTKWCCPQQLLLQP